MSLIGGPYFFTFGYFSAPVQNHASPSARSLLLDRSLPPRARSSLLALLPLSTSDALPTWHIAPPARLMLHATPGALPLGSLPWWLPLPCEPPMADPPLLPSSSHNDFANDVPLFGLLPCWLPFAVDPSSSSSLDNAPPP
jgi:hypothetical protein